ncbi:hypothetical protein PHYBOEH_009480 [Phytophthora boehmeriae]|uniref:Uncharacterized protein n=1 Tax=Phytophthora boehmeriae TaxID=109152 RepID=A0A8T1XEZ3_9STRA|nr:hypothetical protein PHYBOEH_009480 [Phytophthora boehmeriae]
MSTLSKRYARQFRTEPLLFNLVPNVSAVSSTVNVPSRLQDHQAVYGHAELLFKLPVPKEELVQSEGFLRDRFLEDQHRAPIILNGFQRIEIVRVWVEDVDDILRVFYDLHEWLAVVQRSVGA